MAIALLAEVLHLQPVHLTLAGGAQLAKHMVQGPAAVVEFVDLAQHVEFDR